MGWHKLLLLGVESHSDPPARGSGNLRVYCHGLDPIVLQGVIVNWRRISNACYVSCSNLKRSCLDNDLWWNCCKRGIIILLFSRREQQGEE
jgi:hypothetical protein